MSLPFVSIICPVYNEEKHIEHCIESVLQQDYPKDLLEILFIDGMSTDKTRTIIAQYTKEYSFIKLLDNPKKIVPCALNLGIQSAVGEIIIRLDGHCDYPPNYISSLAGYLYELKADNVGCVINTQPADNSIACRAMAIASSHKFGVGNSKFRTGTKNITEADTVPFGCYRREVFDKIGLFDEELVRNQDDEFNARLINADGKIYLIPDLIINYTARDSVVKMMKMFYQYGLFKPLVNKKLGSPATVRQFFPAAFLCGLVLGAVLSCFFSIIFLLYGTIIALYFFAGLCIGIGKIKSCKDFGLAIILPVTFFLIHASYGWGYLKGLYKIMTHSTFQATVNR